MPTRSRSPHYSRRRSPSPYTQRKRMQRSPSPSKRSGRDWSRKRYSQSRSRSRSRSRSPPNGRRRRSPPPRSGRYYQSADTEDVINDIPRLPGETYFEYRKRVRDSSTITVWASSPVRRRSLTPTDVASAKRKRRSTHSDSESVSDSESDSDDRRGRSSRRHKSKRSSKKKHKHRSSKKKKRARSPSPSSSSSSSSEEEREVTSVKSNNGPPALEVDESQLDAVQDLWVEKNVELPDDLAPVGPVPLSRDDARNEREYGGALLPGEGSAMAAYVQQGKRIPRRGEIGLSGDQIAEFESAGFVMSGNRHHRMNAVRMRKENQVISAEEKRLLLQHVQESKLKRENEVISGFREMINEKMRNQT